MDKWWIRVIFVDSLVLILLCRFPSPSYRTSGLQYRLETASFPSGNEMVSLYAGVPVVNILRPMDGHFESKLLCSASPILSLQVPENGPIQITPKQCPAAVMPTVSPAGSGTPVGSGTPARDSPTMAPSESSASTNSMFLSTASIVLGLMLGGFAI